MKYIVDLPDAYTSKSALLGDILSIPICLERGKRYGVPTGIKLEPYTEPDKDEIRQMAHEEAWEFARRIICPSDCCEDSISAHTKEIFNKEGWEIRGIFNGLSYQEAKAKYDAWKKQKDEIRIGDELINHIGKAYIIYDVDDHIAYGINLDKYPCSQECFPLRDDYYPKRTGRTFPEVAELLKKMRDTE